MESITFPRMISRGYGIDVHKKVVVVTIDGSGPVRKTRDFSTFTSSLTELKEWLLANGIERVAMESTGDFRSRSSMYWSHAG